MPLRPNDLLDAGPIGPGPANTLAPRPTWADAAQFNANAYQGFVERQNALPPQSWADIAGMYANGLLMGSTAPGEASLLAAIRHRGKVYKAPEDYPTHFGALKMVPDNQRAAAMGDANNRGFVTDSGKYLDRFDAADYAKDNRLIARDAPPYAHTHNEMIAEWLQSYRDWIKRGTPQQ